MPGASSATVEGSRFANGSSLTDCSLIVMPSSAVVVSISSALAVTLHDLALALATFN